MHDKLLNAAQLLIESGHREEAASCLALQLRQHPADLQAHHLIERHRLPGNFTEAFAINAEISPLDDIFRFFAHHPSSTNPIRDYLSDGWRTLLELKSVLEEIDRPLSRCSRFLEFASGFGRFTRHLVKALPAGSLHVSDVAQGSVDFLKQQFQVQGQYSTTRPAELRFAEHFDTIFVLSLFSHLPHSTWADWLQVLYEHLAPQGVLVFTTHGEIAARRLGAQVPDSGFLFIPSSESTELSTEDYGSTFCSSDYVKNVAASRLGEARLLHYPGHFWGLQDGFALIKP